MRGRVVGYLWASLVLALGFVALAGWFRVAGATSPSLACNAYFDISTGNTTATCVVAGIGSSDAWGTLEIGDSADSWGTTSVRLYGEGDGTFYFECTTDVGGDCWGTSYAVPYTTDALGWWGGGSCGDAGSESAEDFCVDSGGTYTIYPGSASLDTVEEVAGLADGDYPPVPGLGGGTTTTTTEAGESSASAVALLGSYGSGFGSAVVSWVGDVWPVVLGLVFLGFAWALFRRFGRQVASFFGR